MQLINSTHLELKWHYLQTAFLLPLPALQTDIPLSSI